MKHNQLVNVWLAATLLAAQVVAAPPTITDLGVLQGFPASAAYGLSSDGSVVMGACFVPGTQYQGFRWDAVSGLQAIPFPPGATESNRIASDISLDGSTIVGDASGPGIGHASVVRGIGHSHTASSDGLSMGLQR